MFIKNMVLREVTQAATLSAHVEGVPGRKKTSTIAPSIHSFAGLRGSRMAMGAERLQLALHTASGPAELPLDKGRCSTIRVVQIRPSSRTKISLTMCVCPCRQPTYPTTIEGSHVQILHGY